jgi:2-amino-4-hydroxy-6-hydroxymethyldihydropteridine diphosphokinase
MKSDASSLCLLIGSNIEPERNLKLAVVELHMLFHVLQVSNAWETKAIGSEGPNFLNAAVLIRSIQDPYSLKIRVLRPLERRLGRVRTEDKLAPRPIDIDILTWGGLALDLDLWRYTHLAVPTAELLPNLTSPETGERLESAARRLMATTPARVRSGLLIPGKLEHQPYHTHSITIKE